MLPSGWIFITLCIILRSAEGIGTALFITAFFTLVSILYPHSVGTLMVCAMKIHLTVVLPYLRYKDYLLCFHVALAIIYYKNYIASMLRF